MPIHDWTRVKAGIFHHFHHRWISAISDSLNAGLLPPEYYALAEQYAGGFGPDVLTLETDAGDGGELGGHISPSNGGRGLVLAPPKVPLTAETDMEFYRRKQSTVTVRHVSGDGVVAMVELVSPGNKAGQGALRAFVEKSSQRLARGIHLLIVDLLPPGTRDPLGIHSLIWEEITGQDWTPGDKPLTLAAYESGLTIRAYVEAVAVGDILPEMPLYLQMGAHIPVPLEATYQTTWEHLPYRWKRVLEGP